MNIISISNTKPRGRSSHSSEFEVSKEKSMKIKLIRYILAINKNLYIRLPIQIQEVMRIIFNAISENVRFQMILRIG